MYALRPQACAVPLPSSSTSIRRPTALRTAARPAVRTNEERHRLSRRPGSAWTKHAEGLSRFSFAKRSSRFFLSSTLTRSPSALVGPEAPSHCARRSHLHRVSAEQPNFDDTETMTARPLRFVLIPMGRHQPHCPFPKFPELRSVSQVLDSPENPGQLTCPLVSSPTDLA